MNFEDAKQKAKKDRPLPNTRLHLRLPSWNAGWTTAPFGTGGLGWPTMRMFHEGDFYGYVQVDPDELKLSTWEVIAVIETGENTAFRPNAADNYLTAPHRIS
jgi:hypothetical protein